MPGLTKQLEYKIGADFGEVRREAQSTGDATRKFLRELDALERKQRVHRATMSELGRGFMTFGAAMVAGLGLAAKAAMDWETAFTGVRKTVDGSDREIASLEQELRGLARTLPATHKEIAAVAEAAGQLGIKREDIAGFTKVMIDLGETTNMTADEAATSLAKFSNIMGITAKDASRLGSSLVALGNDGASTEADIMDMAMRIGGAGRTVGMSADKVLGFASALSSVGIQAEAGGTAISKVMVTMAAATEKGGSELEQFAKVAGMSASDFKTAFQTDASGAIIQFIQGLGRMQTSGESVFATLERLNLSDERVRDTLLRAAGASDLFSKALQVGSRGWAENMALAEEANKRYATSASRVRVAGNQIKDAMIDVGAVILPVVGGITQGASDIARAFQNLPGPLKDVVTVAGSVVGGIGLIGGAALFAGPKILDFRDKMSGLASASGGFSKALGKFGLFMTGPWGAAIGLGATLLGVLGVASGGAQRKQAELATAGKSVAQAMREQNGVINESVRQAAAKAAADSGILKEVSKLGIDLPLVTDAILNQGDALAVLKKKLADVAQASQDAAFNPDAYKNRSEIVTDEMTAMVMVNKALDGLIDGKNAELEATKNVDAATKESTSSMKGFAGQTGLTTKELQEAATALDDMISAMDKMDDSTLNARDAERKYVQQLQANQELLAKNGATLDINTKKGQENAEGLDAQAKAARTYAEGIARSAQEVGGAAAGATALKASLESSRPALIQMATDFGMTAEEASKYVDQVLSVPTAAATLITTPGSKEATAELERVRDRVRNVPTGTTIDVGVVSDAAMEALRQVGYTAQRLPNGNVNVTASTDGAYGKIEELIRRNSGRIIPLRVVASGGGAFSPGAGGKYFAGHGGIVSFASGGMHEDHSPQIVRARAGMMRMWAEPETGRESYIPWASDRRAGATDVLRSTADGFGYDLMPRGAPVSTALAGGVSIGGPHVSFHSDGTRIGDLMLEMIRKTVRVQGGNVQSVLGPQ